MQPVKRKNNTDLDVCKKQRIMPSPLFSLTSDLTGLLLEFLFRSRLDKESYCNFRLVSRNFRDITNSPRYFPHLRGLLESSRLSDPAELKALIYIHSSQISSRKTTLYFLKRFAPYLKEIDLLNATSSCFIDVSLRKQLLLNREKIIGLSCTHERNFLPPPILGDIGAFKNLKKIRLRTPRNEVSVRHIVGCISKLSNLEKIQFPLLFLTTDLKPLFDLPSWKFLQIENITIQRSDLDQTHPIGVIGDRIYNGPTQNYKPSGEGYFFNSSGVKTKNYGA
jgi:hypothetical protein